MIAHEIYRNAKTLLTNEAKEARKHHPKDNPMQREIINNQADQQRRQFDFYRMKETISDKQCAQMCNWIDAAAINLHPQPATPLKSYPMKTNAKAHPVFIYLTNQLPTAEDIKQQYGETVPDTIPARLQFVVDCFNSEYNYESNRKRYGSTVNVFAQWQMGAPSIFSVEHRNHAILEIAKEWGSLSENATEREEEKILSNWFNFAALKFAQLCKFNKVQF